MTGGWRGVCLGYLAEHGFTVRPVEGERDRFSADRQGPVLRNSE